MVHHRQRPSPLPVHLISFTARLQQQNVQLGWQSSAEENTSHFEVERSADGKDFTVLATVNAQGNSSSVISYSASDMSPLPGTSYYRLKMVDLDQTFSFSKTVAVSAASAGLQVSLPQSLQRQLGAPLGEHRSEAQADGNNRYVRQNNPLPDQ